MEQQYLQLQQQVAQQQQQQQQRQQQQQQQGLNVQGGAQLVGQDALLGGQPGLNLQGGGGLPVNNMQQGLLFIS